MRLGDVLAPAIGYAERGFPLAAGVAAAIDSVRELFVTEWRSSAATYLVGGAVPPVGRLMRNTQLAETYKRIVGEYALLNHREMTLTKRWPRFGVGSRDAIDVQASMQATVEAFQRGDMTQDEFEDQATLLKEWEEAVAQMQQPAGQ